MRNDLWTKGLVIGIILLFIGASIVSAFNVITTKTPQPLNRGRLYVGGSGPGNYTTIQSAINAANPGDTVFVFNGTYYENVIIYTDGINLIGEDKNSVILDGRGSNVIFIEEFVSNLNIESLKIQNGSNGLHSSRGCANLIISNCIISNNQGNAIDAFDYFFGDIISNCVICNNTNGIYLGSQSNNNNIINCNIFNNNGTGIYIYWGPNTLIENCSICNNSADGFHNDIGSIDIINSTISNNNGNGIIHGDGTFILKNSFVINNSGDGVYIESYENTYIMNCSIQQNQNGVYGEGTSLIMVNTSISSNSECGIHIQSGSVTSTNCDIFDNFADGVLLFFCSVLPSLIINCSVHNNAGSGISINNDYFSEVNVTNCTIYDNAIGVLLGDSDENIWNNMIEDCYIFGNSNYGIKSVNSIGNLIYHNILNNTNNAYDSGDNFWDNGYPDGGNYWSDYTGHDSNYDGIGDTPYNISGGSNQDLYPLITFNNLPHADFISIINDKSVIFNASFSYDYNGAITSYVWCFGDGTNATGVIVNHNYSQYGTYTVTLTVTDNDENQDSLSMPIFVLDLILPEIIDNTQSIGYTGDIFTFNATITDNGDVDVAFVYFWYDNGDVYVAPLSNINDDYWEISIYIENTLDCLNYYFATSDISGNFNSTDLKIIIILDNDNPIFTDNSPIQGTTGDSYTFDITGSDNIGVASVTVTWSHGQHSGTNVPLNNDGDGTWSLTITLDHNLSSMKYTIKVTDTSNNVNTGPQKTVPVTDNDKPAIIDHTPTVAHAGDSFTFNVTVTDNILVSGVWLEYWFDDYAHINTTMTPVGGTQWKKTIAINLTSITLHYIISAVDTSSNWMNIGVKIVPIGPDYPPNTPERPTGPASGKINTEYTYNTSTTDLDNDQMYYKWDWGDGDISNWLGPFESGVIASAQHTWDTKGSYEIKVKAKDEHGLESDWSDPLGVTMPLDLIQGSQQFQQIVFLHLLKYNAMI
jgi:PKD repeat protein